MPPTPFLMCPPDFFAVQYVINPWMHGREGTVDTGDARRQWDALRALLADAGATIALVPPQDGLPDIVFTANAGLVRGGVCVPARFRCLERRGEEPHYARWFASSGFQVAPLPPGVMFEGAGDALFDLSNAPGEHRPLLWAASGLRSDAAAHRFLADTFAADVAPLRLTDPRFYHLDTCFCPLPGGCLLWYPPAFDAQGRAEVERRVPVALRLALSEDAACAFACNAVCAGRTVIMHPPPLQAQDTLSRWLAGHRAKPVSSVLQRRNGLFRRCTWLRTRFSGLAYRLKRPCRSSAVWRAKGGKLWASPRLYQFEKR